MPDPMTTTSAESWSGMRPSSDWRFGPASVWPVAITGRVQAVGNELVHETRFEGDAARGSALADDAGVPGRHDLARHRSEGGAFAIQGPLQVSRIDLAVDHHGEQPLH